jgi:hypothetical protein
MRNQSDSDIVSDTLKHVEPNMLLSTWVMESFLAQSLFWLDFRLKLRRLHFHPLVVREQKDSPEHRGRLQLGQGSGARYSIQLFKVYQLRNIDNNIPHKLLAKKSFGPQIV